MVCLPSEMLGVPKNGFLGGLPGLLNNPEWMNCSASAMDCLGVIF